MHEALLAAGLKADFASMEEYRGAQIDVWAGFKAQYRNVKTMILAYNTLALCRGDHGLANVSTDAGGDVDIWGFWDLDNFGGWIGPAVCVSHMFGLTSDVGKKQNERSSVAAKWLAFFSQSSSSRLDERLARRPDLSNRLVRVSRDFRRERARQRAELRNRHTRLD